MRAVALGMVLLCLVSGCIMEFDFSVPTIELVQIPAGKFTMGSSWGGGVEVTLTKPFWLGKSEVTQRQWQQVMGTKPWIGGIGPWHLFHKLLDYGRAANIAATGMDWNEATAFCDKLTAFERRAGKLKANEAYRLPTEAEWEYACSAGTTTTYSFGDDYKQLGQYAWFYGNADTPSPYYSSGHAHAVGMKQPNPWGLHDIHGNVDEWCSDWYGDTLPGGTDPVGPGGGTYRVFRGGSWRDNPDGCRSANRDISYGIPSARDYSLGFRVARSQSAQ